MRSRWLATVLVAFSAVTSVVVVADDSKPEMPRIDMVLVKGGCFMMGDTSGDGEEEEKPVHEVCLDDFYVGVHEVTQRQWQTVMGNNPSRFKKSDDLPVEKVSWEDVKVFIKKINDLSGGRIFRLPTEAEWEYSCRSGGKEETYCGGDNIELVARFRSNSVFSTHTVGSRSPNGLGIYDMSGNVWEWVEDWYGKKYYLTESKEPLRNPTGPAGGLLKVSRGGAWDYDPWFNRASHRNRSWPDSRHFSLGFRLAASIEQQAISLDTPH